MLKVTNQSPVGPNGCYLPRHMSSLILRVLLDKMAEQIETSLTASARPKVLLEC